MKTRDLGWCLLGIVVCVVSTHEVSAMQMPKRRRVDQAALDGKLLGAIAADNIQQVRYWLLAGANANCRWGYDNSSPLHVAVEYGGKGEIAQLLIDAGADIHACDDTGYTPFLQAGWLGHANIKALDVLLAAGADPNYRDLCGWNALHLLVGGGVIGLLSGLLDAGTDSEARDDFHQTPLESCADRVCAVFAGRMVRALLAAGVRFANELPHHLYRW